MKQVVAAAVTSISVSAEEVAEDTSAEAQGTTIEVSSYYLNDTNYRNVITLPDSNDLLGMLLIFF